MRDQRELMKVKRELDKIPSQGWEMAHWICMLVVLEWAPEFRFLELTKSWPSASCNSSVGAGARSSHWSLLVTGLAPVSLRYFASREDAGEQWNKTPGVLLWPPWIHRYPLPPHTCRQKDFIEFQGSMTLSGKVPVSYRYFIMSWKGFSLC